MLCTTNGVQVPTKASKADVMEQRLNGKTRLAVICGGQSTEHEVSLRSSMTVLKVINRAHYDLTLIGVDKQGRWTLCDEANYLINAEDADRISLTPSNRYLAMIPGHKDGQFIDITTGHKLPPIDVAFSLLHGTSGEDGTVQGLLTVLDIPFIGSGVLGSAVCMDKDMAKRVMRDAGLPVTPWVTLHRSSPTPPDFNAISDQLGLPLFVKPASLGSSVGVSKVVDQAGFLKAVKLAFSYDSKVLVETAIDAREIEISVLGIDELQISLCGEVMLDEEFYTYNSKYSINGSEAGLVVPAHLAPGVTEEITRMAGEAFRVLGCSVLSRVDFFVSRQGQIFINEINSLPGFTPSSFYPRLWDASGLKCNELVEKLLSLVLERARNTSALKLDR